MGYGASKNKDLEIIPKVVHLWEVNGFVKLSENSRNKFKLLIQSYGVRKLARELNFDKETIYSIYSSSRKKGIHSIKHLLCIANFLEYDLKILEEEVLR